MTPPSSSCPSQNRELSLMLLFLHHYIGSITRFFLLYHLIFHKTTPISVSTSVTISAPTAASLINFCQGVITSFPMSALVYLIHSSCCGQNDLLVVNTVPIPCLKSISILVWVTRNPNVTYEVYLIWFFTSSCGLIYWLHLHVWNSAMPLCMMVRLAVSRVRLHEFES